MNGSTFKTSEIITYLISTGKVLEANTFNHEFSSKGEWIDHSVAKAWFATHIDRLFFRTMECNVSQFIELERGETL